MIRFGRPVGWRGESYRHYLAAKGISTSRYFVDRKSAKFLTVYHGTQKENLGSIKREGLRTSGPGWSGAVVPVVSLTPSLSAAVAHAGAGPENYDGGSGGGGPVVLKVKMTPKELREAYAAVNLPKNGGVELVGEDPDFEGWYARGKLERLRKSIPKKFYTYEYGSPRDVSPDRVSVVDFDKARRRAIRKHGKIGMYVVLPLKKGRGDYLPQAADVSGWEEWGKAVKRMEGKGARVSGVKG